MLRRTLRWRIGIGWYLLAILAIPVGALLLAPLFLGSVPFQGFLENWTSLFTDFVPQLLLALVTVQVFEELGWSGFVQHRLQSRHGALKGSFLVALAFAFLHLPTYLNAPISGQRDSKGKLAYKRDHSPAAHQIAEAPPLTRSNARLRSRHIRLQLTRRGRLLNAAGYPVLASR